MAEQKGLKNRGYTKDDVDERRSAAEEFTGATLDNISKYGFDPEAASKNIENMIGTIQIPLGYASTGSTHRAASSSPSPPPRVPSSHPFPVECP